MIVNRFGGNCARGLVLVLLCVLGAEVATLSGVPMAWMIGPMLVSTVFAVSGWRVPLPRQTRITGQTIVATAVGLQLTWASVVTVSDFVVEILIVALGSGLLAIGLAPLLHRLSGVDRASSFFACVPCGPAEMAELAEKGGGNGPLVGLVQGLRIAMVVLIVPSALRLAGVPLVEDSRTASDLFAVGAMTVPVLCLALLTALALKRLGMVSPFFLGPLALASILAVMVEGPVAWPRGLTYAGQFLLGVSLGLSFNRDLLRLAPRFVAASALTTLLTILGCTALALGIASVDGLPFATLTLAAAPGSVTEMSLTANVMGLDVAMVTGFHIVRLFILMPLAPLALIMVSNSAAHEKSSE